MPNWAFRGSPERSRRDASGAYRIISFRSPLVGFFMEKVQFVRIRGGLCYFFLPQFQGRGHDGWADGGKD